MAGIRKGACLKYANDMPKASYTYLFYSLLMCLFSLFSSLGSLSLSDLFLRKLFVKFVIWSIAL